MQKKIVLNEIPSSFYAKELGEGLNGRCFITEDNLTFKEFFTEFQFPKKLELLTDIRNKSFVFPRTLVYKKDSLVGYLSEYVVGDMFFELDKNIDFDSLMSSMEDLECQIRNITFRGVLINDMNAGNIVYTGDRELKVIDTDFYELTSDDDFGNMVKSNMKEFAETIVSEMKLHGKIKNPEINALIDSCAAYGRIKPSTMLKQIRNQLEIMSRQEIETVSDFEKKLTLIKSL